MAAKNRSPEFTIYRTYDAPVKAVWDAWTDPKQVEKWWGPRGFTLTTHSKELKPGGIWHYTMHGPDGVDYPNKTLYHEVEMYSRLVYDHGGYDDKPPLFRVTVSFKEEKGKTKMEMNMRCPSIEAAEEIQKFIKKAGGESTWDRLGEYLEENKTGKDIFVINRSFDAPIDLMFEMWTNPKHLAKWAPPTGFNMEYLKANVKEGGSSFYVMTGDKLKMFGKAQYLKIEKPHRIVYTQQFCDEKENTSRHPLAPTWPESMLTTITLTSEGPNRTRVTINWEVHGQATKEEREIFHAAKGGMTQGWTGSLDKLEGLLADKPLG